jgi:lipid-A-disaccharide synthase
MRYYIIAGEASGDLHGSNLMRSLQKEDPSSEFRFWGGDHMSSVAEGLVMHYRDTAVLGIVEVVSKLRKIGKNLTLCKRDISDWNPDVVILIDYPGFNLRIAKYAKERGFRTFYYIPPKVWARGESRVEKLKKYIDRVYVIFPFEHEYFANHNLNTIYLGNPLLDSIMSDKAMHESRSEFLKRNYLDEQPSIALLAGSRKHEIKYLLPKMRVLEDEYKDYQLLLAGAPSVDADYYRKFLSGSRIKLIFGETYSILRHSQAVVLSSGTASLEAAIIGTPQIVCYGLNPLTAYIAKFIIKVKYASLVNLILGRELVKELLQWNCTPENITLETGKILQGKEREKILTGYRKLIKILGGEGASEKVAKSMIKEIQELKDGTIYTALHDTPLGRLKLVCNDTYLLSVEYMTEDIEKEPSVDKHPILTETIKQLDEYFSEKRHEFTLPIKLNGTDFQKRVWEELQRIPYGQIKTYGEVAASVESKEASRAVGLACKMNPLLIIVPCHRVLGANNKLTGFAIGIDKKSYLLDLERAYLNTENSLFREEIKKNENYSL